MQVSWEYAMYTGLHLRWVQYTRKDNIKQNNNVFVIHHVLTMVTGSRSQGGQQRYHLKVLDQGICTSDTNTVSCTDQTLQSDIQPNKKTKTDRPKTICRDQFIQNQKIYFLLNQLTCWNNVTLTLKGREQNLSISIHFLLQKQKYME